MKFKAIFYIAFTLLLDNSIWAINCCRCRDQNNEPPTVQLSIVTGNRQIQEEIIQSHPYVKRGTLIAKGNEAKIYEAMDHPELLIKYFDSSVAMEDLGISSSPKNEVTYINLLHGKDTAWLQHGMVVMKRWSGDTLEKVLAKGVTLEERQKLIEEVDVMDKKFKEKEIFHTDMLTQNIMVDPTTMELKAIDFSRAEPLINQNLGLHDLAIQKIKNEINTAPIR